MPTVRYTTVNGEVIAEKRGGVRKQYVPDPLGSTVALLDNTQAQTDTFSYWPYGENRTRTGTTATPLQFVGTQGYYQDSTSKAYVRARHLDTAKGRWFSTDPLSFDSGDVNLYRYVQNSPTTSVDPSGMTADLCFVQYYQLYITAGLSPSIAAEMAQFLCGIDHKTCPAPPTHWGPPPIRKLFPPPPIRRLLPGQLTKTCQGSCSCTGPTPPCGQTVKGVGSGKTTSDACKAAKDDACGKCDQPTCTPKHPRCFNCT